MGRARGSFSAVTSFDPVLSTMFLGDSLQSLSRDLTVFLVMPFRLRGSTMSCHGPGP